MIPDESAILPFRPSQPPQAIGKQRPTFQFPKTLLLPLRRLIARVSEQSWLGGRPLLRHVVICGFPRSGSTLLQLMVEACVSDIHTCGRERRALEVAKHTLCDRPFLMTKRPRDIFLVDELRDFYASRPADVRFVLMLRDPRDVLTSVHKSQPDRYYVSAERWLATYRHLQWARTLPEAIVVRFKDLVSNTDGVERDLSRFLEWPVVRPFRDYESAVPSGFETIALNGLRALDASSIHRWRHPRYRERISRLLADELPELPDALIEMGYEADRDWTLDYVSPRRAAA